VTPPRVLFLPDFGTEIGGGHVMRCLTLAAELSAQGAECGFCILPDAEPVIRAFAGDRVQIVSRDWPAPVAVVDGYDYTAEDERALAAEGRRVVAIDDLRRVHDCDLVTDSKLDSTASDYPGRARVLAGSAFALIRPEFLALRDEALRRRDGGVRRVLISLGLTDVGGITERVLRLFADTDGWEAADVVLGAGAASLGYANDLAARDPRFTIHINTKAMAALTCAADVAIGAGGGSLWERAVLGLPTLTLVLAANQRDTPERMAAHGATLLLDVATPTFEQDFADAFGRLVADDRLRKSLSARSASLCDGEGAARVARAILALAAQGESARPPAS
jgi:UDP-2,4-diacetamido-2,4,6-trideoxy-beta-L-altropyranose hydrolase